MITPDIIIALCNLVLLPSLFPMILAPLSQKPPLLSSVPIVLALCVIFFTFLYISLTFSAVMSLLSAMAWLILAIQRIKFLKISKINN
ncbi:MAG: hypothetical protein WCV55_03665 [Candidatus Paceibacterota bacterium]